MVVCCIYTEKKNLISGGLAAWGQQQRTNCAWIRPLTVFLPIFLLARDHSSCRTNGEVSGLKGVVLLNLFGLFHFAGQAVNKHQQTTSCDSQQELRPLRANQATLTVPFQDKLDSCVSDYCMTEEDYVSPKQGQNHNWHVLWKSNFRRNVLSPCVHSWAQQNKKNSNVEILPKEMHYLGDTCNHQE